MADMGGDGQNRLQLLIELLVKNAKMSPEAAKKLAKEYEVVVENGTKEGLKKAMSNTELGKNIFSKLFPQLGLELGEGGKFKTESLYGAGSKVAGGAADGMVKMMKTGLGILEDIYKRLSQASPLLQAVETLFNLAMQLFFMPLGNKLAEELIPAALEMIDDVMDMWAEMENMDLEDILDLTISKFTEIFVGFMNNIATKMEKHGGLIGSIGSLLKMISGLATTFLPIFISFTTNIMTFFMQNFAWIIGAIVAFKVLHYSLMIAQIAATLVPDKAKWVFGIGVGVAAIAGIAVGGTTAIAGHADGYYAASPQLAVIGEGGEGEWIVPDSKVGDFVTTQSAARNLKVDGSKGFGGDSYVFNVYGYTDTELGDIIENKINEMSNRSRLRSGY